MSIFLGLLISVNMIKTWFIEFSKILFWKSTLGCVAPPEVCFQDGVPGSWKWVPSLTSHPFPALSDTCLAPSSSSLRLLKKLGRNHLVDPVGPLPIPWCFSRRSSRLGARRAGERGARGPALRACTTPGEPLAFLSPSFSICKMRMVPLSHSVSEDSGPRCVWLARGWLSLHLSPGIHRCEQMAAVEAQAAGGGTHRWSGPCWADLIRYIHKSGPSVHASRLHGTLHMGDRRTNVHFLLSWGPWEEQRGALPSGERDGQRVGARTGWPVREPGQRTRGHPEEGRGRGGLHPTRPTDHPTSTNVKPPNPRGSERCLVV